MATWVSKGSDTMFRDLYMNGTLVHGLPTAYSSAAYARDVAVSWTKVQLVATYAAEGAVATCVAESSDTMSGDLIMNKSLVRGLPMTFPPSSYTGDDTVSWTQAKQVVSEAASDAVATCIA